MGNINQTFTSDKTGRQLQNSVTGFLWTMDPSTDLVTLTYVGGATREIQYNEREDRLTASFVGSPFVRVPC